MNFVLQMDASGLIHRETTNGYSNHTENLYNEIDTPNPNNEIDTPATDVHDLKYEAESPDELALVEAAATYGCRLLRRSQDTITVFMPGMRTGAAFLLYPKEP